MRANTKVDIINAHVDAHNALVGGAEPLDLIPIAPAENHFIRCNCPLCMGKQLTPTAMSADASHSNTQDHAAAAPLQMSTPHLPLIVTASAGSDVSSVSPHATPFDSVDLSMAFHDNIFGAF